MDGEVVLSTRSGREIHTHRLHLQFRQFASQFFR